MKFLQVILVLSLMTTVACSKKIKPDTEESIPQADTSAVAATTDSDLIVQADEEKSLLSDELQELKTQEPSQEMNVVQAEQPQNVVQEEPAKQIDIQETDVEKVSLAGEIGEYKVEKGETLMMIAFKIYGDYSKWREIANMNPKAKSAVAKGMVLKFKAPAEKFVWNPAGEPYLIKKGDTLGSVSHERYGTPRKWKKVWENNKPLIKNPNLIFAGFTLYTLPENQLAEMK